MAWLLDNIEWIFSGIGVLILSVLVGLFLKRRQTPKQVIYSGTRSNNIQTTGDVTMNFGKDDEK